MEFTEWNYWIEHLKEEELTETEKERAKKALNLLRNIFGENLFKDVEYGAHPIVANILNYAPWTRRWLIWISDTIDSVNQCPNGNRIIERLRNKQTYNEALSVLEFAYKFLKNGFEVELYPAVPEIKKEADLKIINPKTGEYLYVEMTSLGGSKQWKDATKTFNAVSDKILSLSHHDDPDLIYSCKVRKYLTRRHLEEVLSKIENTARKARENGFAEYTEEGTIDLALATEDKRSMLNEWAKSRGIDASIIGPSTNVDEIYRIARKIEEEQRQLPKESLNILIIQDNATLFLDEKNVRFIANELEEYVYAYDHLTFCLLFKSFTGSASQSSVSYLPLGEHMFVDKRSELHDEQVLVLVNRFATGKPPTADSRSKIYKAIIQ